MNGFKTVVLMTAMMVLFILVGNIIGGQNGMMIAFLFSLAMNFGSYWFSDKIVLKMYGAQQVTREEAPQLYDSVEKLAMKAELPMPKVYVMNNPAPNAFATGRNPNNSAVAVTTGILKLLNREELDGVIAHELSHIKNYDILVSTVVVTLLGVITLLADWMWRGRMFSSGSRDRDNNANGILLLIGLIFVILAPIFAQLIYLAISREREYLADASGALLTRYPEGLANALKKLEADKTQLKFANRATAGLYIVDPFKKIKEGMTEAWSTHPPLQKRIAALMQMNI